MPPQPPSSGQTGAFGRGSVTNLLTRSSGSTLAAPSILAADFGRMAEWCGRAVESGAKVLHVDVMDGHFVDNLTMGPDMVRALRAELPQVFLDVHLMVTNPERFVEPFAKAGADHITFHIEVAPPGELRALADAVRAMGKTAGIAINPPTPVDRLWPAADAFDLTLVMSVNPGRGGQAFIVETLEKTRAVRERYGTDMRVEMDGGIGPGNARLVRDSGCDLLVAGSSFFGQPPERWAGILESLQD
ncbi:MAG: ribulose-phosphate 3-epimerase [Phycisphaeraceae bacterium]|nr:ribulose-phosphate 3-epimerase [Phycisphaeraceae bacterium]